MDTFRILLGQFWGTFKTPLGHFWSTFSILLGPFGYFLGILWYFWVHLGILVTFWYFWFLYTLLGTFVNFLVLFDFLRTWGWKGLEMDDMAGIGRKWLYIAGDACICFKPFIICPQITGFEVC